MTDSDMREPGVEWLVPEDTNRDGSGLPAALRQHQNKSLRRISMRAIRSVAMRIADLFQPEKIILFGSYAYGNPRPESDVDLLVVMDTPLRTRQQRLEISRALSPRPFALDIVVRTPQEIEERVALGDLFLREIVTRGKVLYESNRR